MSGHDEALDRIAATLAAFGVRFVVVGGYAHTIEAADVRDIIHSKRAANRGKDRIALDLLETQLRTRQQRGQDLGS